jgi:HAE1 family hydrophobic/amphiphilic exporter-1
MQVLVDPAKLASRSLTWLALARALDQENRDFSAGDFDEGKRSYVVRTVGEYKTPGDIESVIIARRDGAPVYVRDVASVKLDYKDPTNVVRQSGRSCIAINVVRQSGANVLEIMEGLREAVHELNEGRLNPRGFKLYQVYDETDYIYSSLSLVQQNLLVGSLLAVMVLYMFLRTGSTTLVIGLAIPISIMGTFIALWLLDRNLNVISLAGMTFAAGMLVDNSIVVLENIYRHRETGKSLIQAAYDGTAEVWGAVLASTLTTIAVFIPIVFIEEQSGQLFRDIAIAISAGVGLSLLVSITVIPSLAARILTTRKREYEAYTNQEDVDAEFDEPVFSTDDMAPQSYGLADRMSAVVSSICANKARRLITIVGIIGLSCGLAWTLVPQAEYLPTGNRNLVIGILLPPPGYNMETFVKMGHTIAQLDGPSIRNFFYVARGRMVFMGARTNEDGRAKELIPLMRRATADLPGVISIITQRSLFQRGLGEGRNIDMEITGPDLNALVGLGGKVFQQVKGLIPGAQVRPKPSLDLGTPELHVKLRRDRAADLQLTNQELGFTINALVDGAKASDYKYEGDEIDLTIRGEDRYATRTQDIEKIPIHTPGGRLTTVGAIADVKLVPGPEQINHIERERAIVIQVIPPSEMPIEAAMALLQRQIIVPLKEEGSLGQLYNIRLSGTADDLTQTYDALKWNLLLALLITYLLIAALFESFLYPLVIITSVPLAAAGGLLGLALVNQFVILVVHQALNFLDSKRREGIDTSSSGSTWSTDDPTEAIAESVRTRFRPIMMSMLTTTFGLFPLVVSSGAGSELYRGIGSIVLGGLVTSTIFTLVLVPALFSFFMDLKKVGMRVIMPKAAVSPSMREV